MLNGLYGYIFGSEDSNDSISSQEPMESMNAGSMSEVDDWCLVNEPLSDRSSPVMIPFPELRDIDSLSFASKKLSPPPSADAVRRAEENRRARALNAHRLQLERVLFSDAEASVAVAEPSERERPQVRAGASASKLKRATAASLVSSDSKIKSRSKKAAKGFAGRNNDRKVNNLA